KARLQRAFFAPRAVRQRESRKQRGPTWVRAPLLWANPLAFSRLGELDGRIAKKARLERAFFAPLAVRQRESRKQRGPPWVRAPLLWANPLACSRLGELDGRIAKKARLQRAFFAPRAVRQRESRKQRGPTWVRAPLLWANPLAYSRLGELDGRIEKRPA